MNDANVSEIDSIQDLFKDPRCIEHVKDALSKATRPESAEEFLATTSIQTRLGAAAGHRLFKEMGIESRTQNETDVSGPYSYVLLALVCGMIQQGMSITEMNEGGKAEDCVVLATVPSSSLSFEGELSAHVTGRKPEYHIDATVVFKGQKFAWGRGKRILKKLFEETDRQVSDFAANSL